MRAFLVRVHGGIHVNIRILSVLACVAAADCAAKTHRLSDARPETPSQSWQQYATPEDAGFASERLDVARRYADSVHSAAVMIVRHRVVVQAWGDISRKLELHSVRKSIVSALYGIAVDRHEIDIDRTLEDLGITDRVPLSETEQSARVRDLLAARSGIYLPAAYADAGQDAERPARGSHAPNTFWWYNNWDFNALGTIYEQFVDSSFFQSLATRLAQPLGMEDYTPADGFLVYEPSNSIHPAHTIRMSARDLARFGQLYLQGGAWNGRQIVPRAWVIESTRSISNVGDGRGYGYLWWTAPAGYFGPKYPALDRRSLYYGTGTGGQVVIVIPSDDMVIVHRGDTDHGRNVAGRDIWRMVEMILDAEQPSTAGRATIAVTPIAFASQLPAAPTPSFLPIDSTLAAEVSGSYAAGPNLTVKVYSWHGRLFGNFPGQGEAELLALSRSEFTVHVQPGVRFLFERDSHGVVTGFSGVIGSTQVRGVKLGIR